MYSCLFMFVLIGVLKAFLTRICLSQQAKKEEKCRTVSKRRGTEESFKSGQQNEGSKVCEG